jgi:hypothetical protein
LLWVLLFLLSWFSFCRIDNRMFCTFYRPFTIEFNQSDITDTILLLIGVKEQENSKFFNMMSSEIHSGTVSGLIDVGLE